MAGETETWRRIADDLASRLQYPAAAAGSIDPDSLLPERADGCPHPLHKADPDCPFCEDRRAYRRYLAKRQKTTARKDTT